jgi:hypothetical protein
MVPAGYMAKRIEAIPEWIKSMTAVEIHSVSNCVSRDFTDYINFLKHNGYWFFDRVEIIQQISDECSIDSSAHKIFYYEVYEFQFLEIEKRWEPLPHELPFPVDVNVPETKQLEGFDVTTFSVGTSPECSPLSCCNLAEVIPVNRHCLIPSFDDAKKLVESGAFDNSEPGPFRIFAVYSAN